MTMPSVEKPLALEISYFPETDTLVLRPCGQPTGPFGETVALNLYAFTDHEGFVNGVTLEHAADMLRPYFSLHSQSHEPAKETGPTAC